MSVQTWSYNLSNAPAGSPAILVLPDELTVASVNVTAIGSAGGPAGNLLPGVGAKQVVSFPVPVPPSAPGNNRLRITCGGVDGTGFNPGGHPGVSSDGRPQDTGGYGGGSTLVELSTDGGSTWTKKVVSAGGGGAGGGNTSSGGQSSGGAANASPQPGQPGYGAIGGGGGFAGTAAGNGAGGARGDTHSSPGVGASGTVPNTSGGNGGASTTGGAGGGGGGGRHSGGGGGGSGTGTTGAGGGAGQSWTDGDVTGTIVSATTLASGTVKVTATVPDPPFAPFLGPPGDGAQVNMSGGTSTLGFSYQPRTNSGTMNAFCLTRVDTSTGVTDYYNPTGTPTHWSSTPVWIPATSPVLTDRGPYIPEDPALGENYSVSFSAGDWVDGDNYTWTVATQENTQNLQSPPANPFSLISVDIPVVTITNPGASTVDVTPTVAWTIPGGDTQAKFRVLIYTATQVADPSFQIGWVVPVADSHYVTSATQNWSPSNQLPVDNYVVYVWITDTFGIPSDWASQAFAVIGDGPAEPTVTLDDTPDTTGQPQVEITIVENDNLLSYMDSTFNTGTGTWAGLASTSIADISSWSAEGGFALQMTRTGSTGPISAGTGGGSDRYFANPGDTVWAMARLQAPVTPRPVALVIVFTNAGGTILTNPTVDSGTDSLTGHNLIGSAVAPAMTARVQVFVTAGDSGSNKCAINEVHNLDKVGLWSNGTPGSWSAGGFIGVSSTQVFVNYQDSDDDPNTWTILRNGHGKPFVNGQITVYDQEVRPGINRCYRARVSGKAPVEGGISLVTLTGPWSDPPVCITVDLDGRYCLSDPTIAGSGVMFDLASDWKPNIHEVSQRYYPFGRKHSVKATDGTKGIDGQIVARTIGHQAWRRLNGLIESTAVLLLQTPFDSWYISTEGDRGGTIPLTTMAKDGRGVVPAHHDTTITYVQADQP